MILIFRGTRTPFGLGLSRPFLTLRIYGHDSTLKNFQNRHQVRRCLIRTSDGVSIKLFKTHNATQVHLMTAQTIAVYLNLLSGILNCL